MKATHSAVGVYEPLQTLKPVDDNIWVVDGPLIHFKSVPFPTRTTIVRLQGDDLFVHSPVELTPDLKRAVDELGEVKHLVSPNRIHYWWIGQWAEHYPDAKKWASPGARAAAQKCGWGFDADLDSAQATPWHAEMEQLLVTGSRVLEEVVFFHRSSRTLILADLIENFEPQKVHSKPLKFLMKLAGILDPDGKLPIDLRLSYRGRHLALNSAIETMLAWQPERLVVSHGRWYRSNATEELKRAFRWVKVGE
ncbi:DUF4336 domain-containing protein [Gilvimarinus algae]|uniref:DUF4336 domain-containing protein n=1 Tax=Gilvimarinus algae TaxID=3058037 RepID=A0ABT8TBS2_9GAMM|nr:DUF4336 domain-containing protein [Gilvimarinus sp. SDUM040014]MDO3381544.1 DUF4336 domain-containing protein [Gilvimarinus sp. SDUM040014]